MYVKMAVDADVTEFPALKAGLVVAGVIISEGGIMVTAGPPDFGVGEGDLFFFGQGGW